MSTYLVTGGSRGIGLELCRQLGERGDHVIAVCRTPSKELGALGVRVEAEVDVTDDAAILRLTRRLEGRVDVVVNNAGILKADDLSRLDMADVVRQIEVNALGPLRLTRALLPHVPDGGKLVFITSRMGSIGDNGSGGYYGYRMSKAALNAAAVSMARDLASRGILVSILHPGMVATDMTGGSGIPVHEAARGLLARIDEVDAKRSGHFYHQSGEELPW